MGGTLTLDVAQWDWLKRLLAAIERSAVAQEKLIELAEKEQMVEEVALPAICPVCGTVDPPIRSQINGEGKMSDFALVATCDVCHEVIIGIPLTWQMFTNREEADQFLKGRQFDE